MESASLELTSSRLLMNECFLYLSSQPTERRLGGGQRKMKGGQKRKKEEAIKKFPLSGTNALFRRGSVPRLSDNEPDIYCTAKLLFFLHV